jgi:dodecin
MVMESVYKVVDIIGTSDKSWEEAAKIAVTTAAKTLRDLRVAEVRRMDMKIEEGKLIYRVKMNVSFKYED